MDTPVEQIIDELVQEALSTDGFVNAQDIAARAQEKFPSVEVTEVVDRVISKVGQTLHSASW